MENQKDIKAHNPADYLKEVNNPNFAKISPFGENLPCAFAYKRTERILTALYLVTNLVPEGEPARSLIRDKSLRLLSDILSLRSGFRLGDSSTNQLVAAIHEITSLLNILYAGGFISDMNTEVLKREYVNLILFLREAERDESGEGMTLREDYFEGTLFSKFKGHNKGHQMSFISRSGMTKNVSRSKTLQGQSAKRAGAEVRHSSRRDEIIKVVKDKKIVSIKDIAEIVTGCSEKTIQRELLALVESGVLKKTGERRWSTYSLL
ncbi:hypothetical protein A3D62_01790 [Candidatus Kaiserbacteria bacterium RIFCSPHIGHO2_02_FULL_49_11]|uniref:HTH deoR-type domain-containing protein n=1 Tax=Candidatus Kaiserbacteria bacterium RIFCSPHIGHO2_02_FULL_49_11 TaxID=1798489 RepID=A0A1F6D1M6_9BACT|nr:MAG: hypothetical protein A3D62_01790 [Candidatus Kaiserbacteria bacterium RIFCSPHIGHO2_02_FULL_49_11]